MWDVCTNTSTTGQRKKQARTTRASWKQWVERMSPNLTTLLDLCNKSSRGIGTNNVFRKDGETQPLAEAGHQTQPLAEAKHRATEQGKRLAPKLRETWTQNITRHSNRFHGFVSSWSLLNQGTKRCCVCRDFTAARCDHKESNQMCMAGQSLQNSTCHVKGNKT